MSFENESCVDFNKPRWSQSSSQCMKGIMSRLDITGDEAVQIVFPECIGQLPIR